MAGIMGLDTLDLYLTKPIDLLEKLDDNGKRHFFLALDYMADCLLRGKGLPPPDRLRQLTDQTDLADYVRRLLRAQGSLPAARETVAALQRWKPPFLALAPGGGSAIGLVGGPGAAVRPGLPTTAAPHAPVKRSDTPLGGAVLGDGAAVAWAERLAAKSGGAYAGGGTPLLANYSEAVQALAELASLEYKGKGAGGGAVSKAAATAATAADGDAADAFPTWPGDQQKLVAQLYDAILNMDGILETRKPRLLRLREQGLELTEIAEEPETEPETPCTADTFGRTPSPTPMPPKRKRAVGGDGAGAAKRPFKENVSVAKVKGLSRIEVEILSWTILFKIKDVHEGRLSFLPWSGKDWGWDPAFASFRARFDAVVDTLRRSKAAVCSLLESDYMARLAAHPRREIRRKENNRSQNAERNAQVYVGRYAIGAGQVTVTTGGNLEDRDGNVVASAATDHSGLIAQAAKLRAISKFGGKKRLRLEAAKAARERRGATMTPGAGAGAGATPARDTPTPTPPGAGATATPDPDSPRTQPGDDDDAAAAQLQLLLQDWHPPADAFHGLPTVALPAAPKEESTVSPQEHAHTHAQTVTPDTTPDTLQPLPLSPQQKHHLPPLPLQDPFPPLQAAAADLTDMPDMPAMSFSWDPALSLDPAMGGNLGTDDNDPWAYSFYPQGPIDFDPSQYPYHDAGTANNSNNNNNGDDGEWMVMDGLATAGDDIPAGGAFLGGDAWGADLLLDAPAWTGDADADFALRNTPLTADSSMGGL